MKAGMDIGAVGWPLDDLILLFVRLWGRIYFLDSNHDYIAGCNANRDGRIN